jgi:bifunctional UDP-N-acetylglucosamine pyrophosphorylase/glucosamine-1-phosphate N-acetyltransferase
VTQKSVAAVIMAAGKGTRLKSELPKVLHPLFGKPLLIRVLETLQASASTPQRCYVILGHGREQVAPILSAYATQSKLSIEIIVQEPQLGTGHALLQARPALKDWQGDVVILSGDAPLLQASSLDALITYHQQKGQDLTLLSATMVNPFGYGRVIEERDRVLRIVEEKDANDAEKAIQTVNTGIYCLNWTKISPLLDRLSNQNAQEEFYLTDLIALAVKAGYKVTSTTLADWTESLGVNSRQDLAQCHTILNNRTLDRLMSQGVSIVSPQTTFIAPEAKISPDTTLLPGCTIMGEVLIGRRCEIGPYTTLTGPVEIADNVRIIQSVVRQSIIGAFSSIGPFAQLRDGVELSHHVHIGNFVEVKKTQIDHHSNAGHLSYLGDASLGTEVNIGAGTITANFDPIRNLKSTTTIEDGVKVGSNTVLVAPLSIGKEASVAAGSVITHDVSAGDLAIARGRQTDIKGWVVRTKEKLNG